MRHTDISPEEAMKQIQKIFKKRGTKALEMARKEILQEKIECKEVKEALTYFMTEYWHDVARPALLSLVCEAVGGDPELTTPIAVPMILLSGAIDIHDDIIDQSKTKDGRPTVYGKFGKDIALLIGDALMFKGLTLLNRAVKQGIPPEKMPAIIDIIHNMFFELGDAEAMELPQRGSTDISPDEYLKILRKKAADVEAHTRISVIIGGGSRKEIEKLGRYGRLLGMLMILRDDWVDVLDLRELQHRIRRECLPLPILYALRDLDMKLKTISVLRKKMFTKTDAETLLKIAHEARGFKYTEKLMKELVEDADMCIRGIKHNRSYLELLAHATLLSSYQ